jgi:acetamidase/formamidase
MSFAEREPLRRQFPLGPYSNLGPVEIRGAEPGDVLECRMLEIRTIDWGWNSFPLGVGALPADFEEPYLHYFRFDEERSQAEFVDGIRIPLAPFMGVFAVEPADEEPVSAILAGAHGGNLDLAELVTGTSLFLPVFKSGARVWSGDANPAQGDGVVDQTGSVYSSAPPKAIHAMIPKNVLGDRVRTPQRHERARNRALQRVLGVVVIVEDRAAVVVQRLVMAL